MSGGHSVSVPRDAYASMGVSHVGHIEHQPVHHHAHNVTQVRYTV